MRSLVIAGHFKGKSSAISKIIENLIIYILKNTSLCGLGDLEIVQYASKTQIETGSIFYSCAFHEFPRKNLMKLVYPNIAAQVQGLDLLVP
jgi:hypothetical protein